MEFIVGNVERETITCRACIKPINAERFYKCVECDFSLHEFCANLPRKIRSVLISRKLTLVGGASYFHDTFRCDPCGRYSSGFRYIDDSYKVDLQCVLTRETVKREAHPHHLYYFTSDSNNCSSCNKKAAFAFRCLKGGCVFTLCFICAIVPERVTHKSDDHPLRLCYQEYGKGGKYWCDICEKEVDSHAQYYTCDDCRTTFHMKCVLGDMFRGISPGSIIKPYWFLEYEVVANNGINRPFCSVCQSRCTSSLVLKAHDDLDEYYCSDDCFPY